MPVDGDRGRCAVGIPVFACSFQPSELVSDSRSDAIVVSDASPRRCTICRAYKGKTRGEQPELPSRWEAGEAHLGQQRVSGQFEVPSH